MALDHYLLLAMGVLFLSGFAVVGICYLILLLLSWATLRRHGMESWARSPYQSMRNFFRRDRYR